MKKKIVRIIFLLREFFFFYRPFKLRTPRGGMLKKRS